jgi:hypothetical protein
MAHLEPNVMVLMPVLVLTTYPMLGVVAAMEKKRVISQALLELKKFLWERRAVMDYRPALHILLMCRDVEALL